MNLDKLFSLRRSIWSFVKCVNRSSYSTKFFPQETIRKTAKVFQLWSGVLFIWPTNVNKQDKIEEIKILPSSSLETADIMFETGRYEDCYNFLNDSKNQDDIEVKWRICRVLYNMAKDPKYNKTKGRKMILEAYEIIAAELDNHWDNFAVQKWYALTLDAKSSNDGLKQRIEQLTNVKKHMDLAVTLNPNDATLLHMLGEWCYQITDLPWHQRRTAETFYASLPHSTYEDALEYYLRAETAQPRFYSINLLRLGCCYLKLHKVDQAKYYLKLAASYPAKSNDDHQANKEASELLKKLK